MEPDSRELLGLSAEIHLLVEELADCLIVELDADARHFLLDRNEFLHK
jgi:hypothetical protein